MSLIDGITKGEIKFWLAIIGVIVSFTIAFTTLKMTVSAMQDKGVKLRADMIIGDSRLERKVDIMMDRQIKIMVELGIEP